MTSRKCQDSRNRELKKLKNPRKGFFFSPFASRIIQHESNSLRNSSRKEQTAIKKIPPRMMGSDLLVFQWPICPEMLSKLSPLSSLYLSFHALPERLASLSTSLSSKCSLRKDNKKLSLCLVRKSEAGNRNKKCIAEWEEEKNLR